jgi:hypothetical protein
MILRDERGPEANHVGDKPGTLETRGEAVIDDTFRFE